MPQRPEVSYRQATPLPLPNRFRQPDHETPPPDYTPCHHERGGGKVRLSQRPEVSSEQATPLPLPNRLRQPDHETNHPQTIHRVIPGKLA